jgi:hypothetical protein
MAGFAITLHHEGAEENCSVCGKAIVVAAGPRLVCADSLAPVCRNCGKKYAPSFAALLELTATAERVGGVSRHTLVPPMEALLELAHAADGFMQALSLPKTSGSELRPMATREAALSNP